MRVETKRKRVSRMVKKLEATEEPQLATLHFGVTSIQSVRVKAVLHDVKLE